MTDKPKADKDRRQHSRFKVAKTVRASSNGEEHHGSIKDISISGVAISTEARWEKDRVVEVDIDDMEPLEGTVARSLEDGIAIEFDLDEDDEDRLLAEMGEIRDAMRSDE